MLPAKIIFSAFDPRQVNARNGGCSYDEPFILHLRMVPEVDKQTQPKLAAMQVVEQLGTAYIGKLWKSFDLNHDRVVTEEINSEELLKSRSFVIYFHFGLRYKWNVLKTELE
jgi:hypothetical protein